MEIEKLNEWNPWWENSSSIKELSGKLRPTYAELLNSLDIKEVTIITGIRRGGKSTLMYQMIKTILEREVHPHHILFINLEDKKLAYDSLEEMYLSYRQHLNVDEKCYVFLDEVHKKEGWEAWVRKRYDQKAKVKFVISGSCSYLLKKEYSTLLTGRNLTFEVFPLSFEEFLSFKGIALENIRRGIIMEKTKLILLQSLEEYIFLGGFPEVFFKLKSFRIRLLEQYFDDILYKDIVDRYNLNAQKARDLALFLATNFTGIISLRNLRNALGLSYDTIKDYLSYYQEAFLFFTIDHFSYSFKEQKTLPVKVYSIDNGLRNAVAFKFSKDEGKLVENLVLVELKRKEKIVYYWQNRGEVDFVINNQDGSLTAINVSYGETIEEREFNALLEFKKEFPQTKELILITKQKEEKEKEVVLIPLWKWLLDSKEAPIRQ